MNKYERLNWEELALLLGDLYAHYHTSQCYVDRHTYGDEQRELMINLSETIQGFKNQVETNIVKLLVGVSDE